MIGAFAEKNGDVHSLDLWTFHTILIVGLHCTPLCGAADKSGVSPNTISLPKGPGSIEGLGESFQPTLNTGTAKYSVGLKLTPGTAGHTPELRLVYEGGSGNGPVGYGWQLPWGFIQRQTDKGIPRYVDGPNGVDDDFDGETDEADESDRFIEESKEELVPVNAAGQVWYFCRNEGSFTRYRRVMDFWEGTRPDGSRLTFGRSPEARVVDPSNSAKVFRWLLEQETDTRGNTIRYGYRSFPDTRNQAQKYLSLVEYGAGAPPWSAFHFVTNRFEDREDWFEDCRAGFAVRTGKRLVSVTMGTQGISLAGHQSGDFSGDGVPDCLDRTYRLTYRSASYWSVLASIAAIAADGASTLPPSRFEYTECRGDLVLMAQESGISSENPPPEAFDRSSSELTDLNGDGLPDLLRTFAGGLAHTGFINEGSRRGVDGRAVVRWSHGRQVNAPDPAAWLVDLSSDQVHLADMDGDGLADLVRIAPFNAYYFACRPGSTPAFLSWGLQTPVSTLAGTPPAPYEDVSRRTRVADLDCDKRTDVLQGFANAGGYKIWFNLGGRKYSYEVTRQPATAYDLGNPSVHLADINGDRIPDLVWIRPSTVLVTPGLGHGRFDLEVPVSIPTTMLSSEQLAKARLQDVNGDGLADLVIERAAAGELWFWVNRGNYTLEPRRTVMGTPQTAGLSPAIRWADLNGNGTVDAVYADSETSTKLQAVDIGELLGCVPRPHLLRHIENGIGRVTDVDYETSTAFALADGTDEQGNYQYAWPSPLPFPVDVVARVKTADSLGHVITSEFRYHEGYYDTQEKQFRGFGRVEQIDIGDQSAPTLVTRSHFDTGRDHEAMKGKLLLVTSQQEDGSVFAEQATSWTIPPVNLATGVNGEKVKYVHPMNSARTVRELGQGMERRLESETDYDGYGNVVLTADYGVVVGGDRAAFNDERITTTEYAVNTNAWILRTPARQETKDENGGVLSRTEFFYDDETFSGDNWGVVTIGNLTMRREWKDPAVPTAYIASTRTKYDTYGNPTAILDPLAVAPGGVLDPAQGHAREIAYEPRFHMYPVTETIHLGNGQEPLIFRAAYDEAFGTVTSSTDFNENTTLYSYDTFARLSSIVKPGDTPEYPTVEYDYALAVPADYWSADGLVRSTGLVNYVETRQLDKTPGTAGARRYHCFISRQFVDGLGRKLMTKTEAEPAPGSTDPRVVVSEATQFNARQKPARVLNPFFSLAGGTLDDLLAFENIEAPGWQGQFHNEASLVTLDLASAHATRTDYDAALRPAKVTNPDGTQRRTVYEPLLTRSFDENQTDTNSAYFGNSMVHVNDGLGRLIQVDEVVRLTDDGLPLSPQPSAINPVSWTTRYEYDLNDQLTRITDSQNNVKTFAYDGLKRKSFMNDPDRGVMHFVYDDASNLTETTDAKAQRITYTYDGANRIRTEKYHDGLPPPSWRSSRGDEALTNSVVYHYDMPFPNLPQGDNTLATACNVKGALAWVEDLSGEEHTSYDSRGRVESVVKRVPDPQFQSLLTSAATLISYRTAFAYDSLDRLTNLVYPDADQLRYEYNDRNLLQRIPGGPSGSIIAGIAYPPSAQMGQIDYGNGVRTTYAYDSRLRLKNLLTASQPATLNQQLINFAYDFDGVSNIKTISDLRPGSSVPEGDPRRNTQLFRYDDLYRLTRVQYSFALPGTAPRNDGEINYRYDRIGNMLAQTSTLTNHVEKGLPVADLGEMDSGDPAGRWNRTGRAANDPPGPHALTAIRHSPLATRQYPYDANGNMTNIDGLVCTWDFKDRLVAVENNEMRAAYAYDYTDRRIIKDVAYKPGSANFTNHDSRITTLYINKYFEVREHDAPTKYVWNGNTRVARVTGSLNTNLRVQRLRLWPGWNLCSLAVSSPSPLWGEGRGEVLSAAFRWNPAILGWDEVLPSDTLPAGTVLWLKASTNATLTVTGAYADPTNRTVPAGGDFLPSAGLEIWNLKSQISNSPIATAWTYDAPFTRWLSWLPPPLELQSDLPAFLAPGQAVFARADAPAQLEVPDSALRIRYYHQDHLGSSGVVADSYGLSVEETSFYPYGSPRFEVRQRSLREAYGFTQKERDYESNLSYSEARYLVTRLSRFASVDPLSTEMEEGWLKSPQELNSYAYVTGRPLFSIDPTGLAGEKNSQVFEDIVERTFGHEGGYLSPEKAKRVGDKGGETKYGISKRSYPKLDIKNLTKSDAADIYRRNYWKKIRGDQLPEEVAYALFDFAVNSGPRTAIKFMQRLVGVKADGKMGAKTMRAMKTYMDGWGIGPGDGEAGLALKLNAARGKFLDQLGQQKGYAKFHKGWLNRVEAVRRGIGEISATDNPVAPPPSEPTRVEFPPPEIITAPLTGGN